MSRAFVFPGQGSQAVGMGLPLAEAFAAAREVFEEVDDALDLKLSKLMFEGPADELTLTENAQPALMAASLAVLRVLEREGGIELPKAASHVAGHSLGEYSALAAVRSLTLADAARLLRLRGLSMQAAVPVGAGAMAALIGVDFDEAVKIAEDAAGDEVCAVANDNGGRQCVLSGDKAAVERATALAEERGVKRAIMLQVSAPFHCELMAPAAEAMGVVLGDADLRPPRIPIVANVTAKAVSDPDTIRRLLVEQVTSMVRWRESIQFLAGQGIDTIVELGTGRVLSGLARRIEKSLKTHHAETPEDIEALLKVL
ncbi:MAG: ACP S-malonyltransferase [Alphaproteobacteria bacterium]|nr:ACP S-malonyltransferase [Alphaproteobacteria bacterium]